ncbi:MULTISPECIES: capsule biosynthesis protein [unclassified Rhizobium]|uniref:capsule biosynthesis protein n=1 Tax=unclassified Rhizobium TaxID=2613769 RepID=UPI000EAA1F73|nr:MULTISPECIES: capsule biosynthesis protein [unclassified Rhizobium]AYG68899.1 capsule biosynthesis protein [Rhizobium sp. CCGE531]AYG75285.1 capsule biosynthesis protein [Rhizobium sp. CCGE532]
MALINSETQSKKLDARQPRQPFRQMIARSIVAPAKTGKRAKGSKRLGVYMLAVVGPTLVVSAYYAFIAAPIYVSEASFVVRMAAPPSSNVFGSLLQNSGITRSQDDTFSVQEYIRSRQALKELTDRLPVRAIFGSRQADRLTRFPRPWENSSEEELYNYYSDRVSVIHNDTTGITMLRTTAFHAQDAADLNTALLSLGGKLLDRLNDRARSDAVRFADNEVQEAQQRAIDAQKNITNFRNKELMIDPNASSMSMVDLITNLTAELANTRARLAETRKTAPDSNAIPFLTSQIAALEQQIENERAKMVGSDKSVAPRIADYESLVLMREFANKALVAALDSLEAARADARRQQLYLEVVVPPHLPDEAEMPYALKNILVVFLSLSLAYLLGWLMLTALRDHESG